MDVTGRREDYSTFLYPAPAIKWTKTAYIHFIYGMDYNKRKVIFFLW